MQRRGYEEQQHFHAPILDENTPKIYIGDDEVNTEFTDKYITWSL